MGARNLPIIIEDIAACGRFFGDVLVTGPPRMNFFAGAPLMSSSNRCVGSLCIMDTKRRDFYLDDAVFLTQSAEAICDIYRCGAGASDYWTLTLSSLGSMPVASDPCTDEDVANPQAHSRTKACLRSHCRPPNIQPRAAAGRPRSNSGFRVEARPWTSRLSMRPTSHWHHRCRAPRNPGQVGCTEFWSSNQMPSWLPLPLLLAPGLLWGAR